MAYSNTPDKLEQPTENPSAVDAGFVYTLIIVMLVVFGAFTLLSSLFYIKDITTLRNVPNLVWDFICGQPIDSEITLPLLLTISMVMFMASGIVYAWKRWTSRATI